MTVTFKLPHETEAQISTEEVILGKRIADAAKDIGIKHFLYSSLPSISKASGGKFTKVYHFENKSIVDKYLEQLDDLPTTVLLPGLFTSNYLKGSFSCNSVLPSGEKGVVFTTPAPPNAQIGYVDPNHDVGIFVRAALDKGPPASGHEFFVINSPNISYAALSETFTRVTGVPSAYLQTSLEEFRVLTERAYGLSEGKSILGLDMLEMAAWLAEAPSNKTLYGTMELSEISKAERELGVRASTWEEFLIRTGFRGP